MRVGYAAIIDLGGREELEELARKLGSYRLEILCPEDINELYRASMLDPDIVDTMKSCGSMCCVLVAYAQ